MPENLLHSQMTPGGPGPTEPMRMPAFWVCVFVCVRKCPDDLARWSCTCSHANTALWATDQFGEGYGSSDGVAAPRRRRAFPPHCCGSFPERVLCNIIGSLRTNKRCRISIVVLLLLLLGAGKWGVVVGERWACGIGVIMYGVLCFLDVSVCLSADKTGCNGRVHLCVM